MLGIGDKLPEFEVTGVKPGFNNHEENGESAFETLTHESFPGKWKVIVFYPKDFTFVCPTEIVAFDKLAGEFEDRDAIVLTGSTDNEFCKLAWRREHPDLDKLATGSSPTRPVPWSTAWACAPRPAWPTATPTSSTMKARSSTSTRPI